MNSFLLTAAILLLLGGKLADHFGRRLIFIIGLIIFLVSSALCGYAKSGLVLITGRVLQAIGASLIYPSATALMSMSFPKNEFGKIYGTIMGFAYLFVAFGPFIGGLFTDFVVWRWIFWINVPICIVCLFIAISVAPKDIAAHPRNKLDIVGLILLMIGLGSLVFALMEGPNMNWSNPIILSLFVLAIIFLVTFGIYELKITDPLLDIRLFKNKEFLAGNIIFPCTAACFTALIFWAIWLQQTFDYSPVTAGLAMIPATAISLFMLRISGAWGAKIGPRKPILLGSILLVLAMYWIGITANFQNYMWIFIGFLMFGFATPLMIPNSISIIMHGVDERLHGVASGVFLTLQHVAFTLGFAVLAATITSYNNKHLLNLTQNSPAYQSVTLQQLHILVAGKNTIQQLAPAQIDSLHQSGVTIYTHAFSFGMLALGLFAILALIFSVWLYFSRLDGRVAKGA